MWIINHNKRERLSPCPHNKLLNLDNAIYQALLSPSTVTLRVWELFSLLQIEYGNLTATNPLGLPASW